MEQQWTLEREAEAIRILKNIDDLKKKSMVLICTKNVQIVKRQRGDIMLPINYISGIIRDAHVACGLKGETKTHKKVQEHYANVSMTAVKDVIRKCEKS